MSSMISSARFDASHLGQLHPFKDTNTRYKIPDLGGTAWTIYGCRVSRLLIFQHERTFIGILFNEVLRIPHCSLHICHVSVDGIISVHSHHQWGEENPHCVIHSRSPTAGEQGRPACFATWTYRQPLPRFPLTWSTKAIVICTTGRGTFTMVLWHILVVFC
jgi:hypothetical protein